MPIILFDTVERNRLFPLTSTRAVADLRMGIFTTRERWEKVTGEKVFVLTDVYLSGLYEVVPAGEYIFIDATVMIEPSLIHAILTLNPYDAIADKNGLIAGRSTINSSPGLTDVPTLFKNVRQVTSVQRLQLPHQLFQWNEQVLISDLALIKKEGSSKQLADNVTVVNPNDIFIEAGASVACSILNAETGPIYIGKNATIMEGSCIRGPFALCEGAVVKMGAKIYGATTIGPYCTAGGEIKNSILTGYSNKAHDGYLGDSVLGEWCNLGAGTSNSNVKNTGGMVSQWNDQQKQFLPVSNKCGVIMGDYSRTAINSSINTGSFIGVCCNAFGNGLLPKLIPDFSWGTMERQLYHFEKAIDDIRNWKKMKNKTVGDRETKVLKHIFDLCQHQNL